jgi:tetratricopeptide (TPR) repeat protein
VINQKSMLKEMLAIRGKIFYFAVFAVMVTFLCPFAPALADDIGTGLMNWGNASRQKNRYESTQKVKNAGLTVGVHDEESVRTLHARFGSTYKEFLYEDVVPAKKILVFRLNKNTDEDFRIVLMAFDKEKKKYIYYGDVFTTTPRYKEIIKASWMIRDFKAGWYSSVLYKTWKQYDASGQYKEAYEFAKKMAEQRSEYDDINAGTLINSAMHFCGCKDYRYRDAAAAVEYAAKAADYVNKVKNQELTVSYHSVLACAYAEKGDFAKAVTSATEAYNIALDKNSGVKLSDLNQLQRELEAYKSNKTYAAWKYGAEAMPPGAGSVADATPKAPVQGAGATPVQDKPAQEDISVKSEPNKEGGQGSAVASQ